MPAIYTGRPPRKHWSPRVESKTEPGTVQNEVVVQPPDMTPEERAIYSRVVSETNDWETITEESVVDYSLSRDLFELPEPARKLEQDKQFKFRWIIRTPTRLDEIRNKPVPFKWWIVNSTQPVGGLFDSFIDSNNGCVSREDQMLVFKPWWMFEKEREYKTRLADAAQGIEAKNGETKSASRDTEVEIKAGKRKGTSNETLRQEIKGSDIQFKGEAELDAEQGIVHQGVTESDLTVDQ